MTLERARELVEEFGLDVPITSRMIFCHPGHPCCEGKRAKGHGPRYEVAGRYVGNVNKARELEQARALVREELARLEQSPEVRRALELARAGVKKGRAPEPTSAEERTLGLFASPK